MIMNFRGQAFSTFQLLIAAVVALAILVLLLNIIGSLPFLSTQKPSTESVNLIKSQVNEPGALRTSNRLIFVRDDSLNTRAIASSSGILTEAQLCISKGDHEDTSEFEFTSITEGDVLRYNGSQLGVKISVLCDTGTELQDDLLNNGIDEDWLGNEKCSDISQLNQTACVIVLRFA
ncbi:MAG: hypothetical protein Q8P05_03780 [Candidatus Diapherotrites archaeon]|nr:hypothetical protein [Candidatus Diapherotrites archaeon]MDZ4256930.1 hypothetical protein [archaeon]